MRSIAQTSMATSHLPDQDPAAALKALTASIDVEEWDTSTLDERLRADFIGYYAEDKSGSRLLVFPAGQDPEQRLAAARTLLTEAGVTA